MIKLFDVISGILTRLSDTEAGIWSRDEIGIYARDGYDSICRRTKCLFEIVHIENLPAVGNYSTDEEYEMALQIPRLILTGKRNFTREVDKEFAEPGAVGPAGVSTHKQIPLLDQIDGATKPSPIGYLPRNCIQVERVVHDGITLDPEFSSSLRDMDNRYENQGGPPGWFTVDKDGLFTLRRYPTGDGAAVYADVEGHFGVEVTDDEYTGDIEGSWGSMCFDSEEFPTGGPWGTPTRTHPDINNTKVEIFRLGHDPDVRGFEVPRNYIKYIEFWACHRALKRDGVGQDLKMSDHYADRFEVGVGRMTSRRTTIQREYVGRIGHGRDKVSPLRINLPANYGRRIRRTGGY